MSTPQITVFSPDGKMGTIPQHQLQDAGKAGYRVVMYDQKGTRGSIPVEQMDDATRSGYTTTPVTNFEKERQPSNHPGFLSTVGSDLKGAAMGLASKAAENPFGLMNPLTYMGPPSGVKTGYEKEKNEQHRSLPYRLMAGLGRLTGVAPVDQMEQSADVGNNQAVLGHAAPSVALAASPLAAEGIGEVAGAAREGIAPHLYDAQTGKLTPRLNEATSLFGVGGPVRAAIKTAFPEPQEQVMGRLQGQALNANAKINAREAVRPGSPEKESGYYPPVTKVPIRPEPPYRLTPESVPGPDTAGKGNLLSPLAKRGDPRAAQELMRRGRNVLYVPAESYPAARETVRFGAQEGMPSLSRLSPPQEGIAAKGLISEPPRTIPEQTAQSNVHLAQQMKDVVRNPKATAEERAMATQRLREMGNQ